MSNDSHVNQAFQSVAANKTQVLGLEYSVAGTLCYFPLFLINLIVSILILATEPKTSRFVRFHAVQSLMLIAANIALVIALTIVYFVIFAVGAVVGQAIAGILAMLVSLVGFAIALGALVLMVMAMIKARQNEMWQMPIIGAYAKRFAE